MLQKLADNLWTLETKLSFPGGVRLPARMTAVRLVGGDLLLHSPVPLSPPDVDQLQGLGRVAHIFAPNKFHHRFVRDASARFPGAALYGVPGLSEKRQDLRFTGIVADESPEAWRADLDVALVQGAPVLNEVVLYHRPSRTIITTDLFFNVTRPATFGTSVALWTMGTRGRFAQSRWWRFYTRQREQTARAAERILRWDFGRVLMSHGDPVDQGARALSQAALSWMLLPLASR